VQRPGCLRAWLLVAALSLTACSAATDDRPSADSTTAGSTTAGSTTAGRTTSSPPTTDPGAEAVVGEEDSGTQVLLRPGQRLRVSLGPDFAPFEERADGVLETADADGGYPTGQPLSTLLVAVAPGAVVLSTSTDAACLHESPPCSLPQQEWTLLVTVAPR